MQDDEGNNYEDEPEEARLKKALTEQYKRLQLEQQKKEIVHSLLDQEAFDRLMNIRLSNPELYTQLVDLLISFAQNGRLQTKMNVKQFLALIQKLTYKPDTEISFKHK
ncbi:MAG: DNA-binding protein [Candidatus Marsarchaeota archaeon]|nr:DNA-binding protein [Candidatus Marsarchaeota archaeon]